MQDLVFAGLESVADEGGFILDLPQFVREPQAWSSGKVHKALRNGQIIRIECDVQILDSGFIADRVERLTQLGEAYVDSQSEPGPIPGRGRNQGKGAIERERAEQIAKLFGSTTPQNMRAIAQMVQALNGGEAAVRLLPCGAAHVEYGFSGTLLGRQNYMQQERESLFSRYGQAPSVWTVVFQVTTVPQTPGLTEFVADREMVTGDRINRGAVETLVNRLMTVMDSIGIAGGPAWPSISITPLGIYRSVPLAPLNLK